jgi:hypothetical protein
MERIEEEAAVVYFKALSHNLSGGEVVGVLELDAIIRHG